MVRFVQSAKKAVVRPPYLSLVVFVELDPQLIYQNEGQAQVCSARCHN